MINITPQMRNALSLPTTQRKGKILIGQTYYDVYNVIYYKDCYENGKVIGNAIASQLEFDIPYMAKFDTFKYYEGIYVNGEYQYINLGTYNVFDDKDNDEFTKHIVSFDNLIKFNKPYVVGNYPMTLYALLQLICQQAGVNLQNLSIPNGSFIVVDNQFPEDTTLKTILKAICAISGTYAIIKDDNLVLQLKNQTTEEIDKSYHEPMDWKRRTYGINQVILGDSTIEGEYVIRQDEEDIRVNGVHKLVINDSPFAYNQAKRNELIDALWNQVRGFGYIPYELKGEWLPHLEIGDVITIDDVETIVLRIQAESPKALNSVMSAPALIDSAIDYVDNTSDVNNRLKRTERSVDKQKQIIDDVVENVDEQDIKISEIIQTVDEINSKIQDIADITVSSETSFATVDLLNINESEPILIKIRPILQNISYLYPRHNLYPSSNLYMPSRTLRFHNNTTNENFDYELPDNLLYYDEDDYDTFQLGYETQTCIVIKKCKYNADGEVELLDNPITNSYPYPSIILSDGDYTISLLGYDTGYIYATLMAKNIYTTQFYTKAETNSIINQTSQSIDLSVNQKLSNYSTTTEMNSAISLSASEINQVVRTKVGNDEIISKINQTAEQITIDASKINIAGTITAINGDTSTTINGNKITTGSITSGKISSGAITTDKIQAGAITTSKVSSDIITTSNFSAQNINANKITSGTLNGTNVNITNLNANNITGGSLSASRVSGGTLSGANIDVYAGTGFLRYMSSQSIHPFASALNMGYGTGNGLSFRSSADRTNLGDPLGHLSVGDTQLLLESYSNSNRYMYVAGSSVSIVTNYGTRNNTGDYNGSIYIYSAANVSLNARNGHVYAGSGTSGTNTRVAVDSSGPSSRILKDNITDFNDYDDALRLLKNIKIYNYNYKYKLHDKKDQYGFIIDDLLEDEDAQRFLYFKDDKAIPNKEGHFDYQKAEEEPDNPDIINFKRYDEETLIKYLLVTNKALLNKVENLENKIKELEGRL